MNVLLFGKDGQVGWELQRSLAPLGRLVALGHREADFTDCGALGEIVRASGADVIVNAAAHTAVDRAEAEPERAMRINGEAVGAIAEAAAATGALLVHYSTDYVFDGNQSTPYAEEDPPGPLSAYGRSKLEGERRIRAAGGRHLIFRTSWVFASRGANFLRTMLRLAAEREELRVIADQFGAPTSAELIADVTALCLSRLATDPAAASLTGTYHLVAGGATSWHGYAAFVIAEARRLGAPVRVADERVIPITTAEYPLPARRPGNSRMLTRRLTDAYGIVPPDWSVHVRRSVAEICARGER